MEPLFTADQVRPLIAGALYDFLGFLTTRPKPVRMGSSVNVYPAMELFNEWAAKRGLSLDDAKVREWQESLGLSPRTSPVP